jgi:hypothetical protein
MVSLFGNLVKLSEGGVSAWLLFFILALPVLAYRFYFMVLEEQPESGKQFSLGCFYFFICVPTICVLWVNFII